MEEQLINFETAKLAKEKGFNISGINIYENKELLCDVEFKNWNNGTLCLLAPTQSLLQKWLREVHNIIVLIHQYDDNKKYSYLIDEEFIYEFGTQNPNYNTYEEALEMGLFRSLKLI
jgi:hypothetical protein